MRLDGKAAVCISSLISAEASRRPRFDLCLTHYYLPFMTCGTPLVIHSGAGLPMR
jgi:hypothetical protein